MHAWQNCGVSYWDETDGKKLAEHIRQAYEQPGGKELVWEEVPLRVFGGSYRVAVQSCNEQDIREIDTYHDLKSVDVAYAMK